MSESKVAARSLLITAFLAIYIIWGSTYLAIRLAVETMPPLMMGGVRFLFAGAVMYTIVRLRSPEKPTAIHWRSTAIVGGFLLLGGNGAVVWAEQYLTSSMTVLLLTTISLWVVLLDWLRRDGVRPGVLEVAGIVLGITGVAILVGGSGFSGEDGIHAGGVIALLCGALSWAFGSIYSRQAPMPKSPFLATSMEMLTGGALLCVGGVVLGESSRADLAAFSTTSLLALGYLIVFGSFIGFTAYIWLLTVTTPAKVSTYAFVNPVIAVFLGCTLGEEPFSMNMLVAMIVIIAGVVLITLQRMKAATPLTDENPSDGVPVATDEATAIGESRLAAACTAPVTPLMATVEDGERAGLCDIDGGKR